MDIELILQKFAVFSGLTGEELQACLPYCRDAMEHSRIFYSSQVLYFKG